MLRNTFSFEPLERRDLLATDLIAGIGDIGGTLSSRPQNIVSNGETTYFDARVDGTSSRKVFVTTGSAGSTKPIFDGQLEDSLFLNDSLYFLSDGSLHVARNDTVETLLARELNSAASRSGEFVQIDAGKAFWIGPGERTGRPPRPEAWMIDDACVIDADCDTVRPYSWPFEGSDIELLGAAQGRAWFLEDSLIWSTDGNTNLAHSSFEPVFSEVDRYITAGSTIFFSATLADDPSGSAAIWEYDTATSPAPKQITFAENLGDFAFSNNRIVYSAERPMRGREFFEGLFEIGAIRSRELVPGEAGSNPEYFTPLADGFVFSAAGALYHVDSGIRLTKLLELNGPARLNGPEHLTAWNNQVYFVADNGDGAEIWRTNGTVAGTQQVVDLAPGQQSSFPKNLTPAGDSLFFSARTSEVGFELWEMSTSGDVRLVKDIRTESFRLPPSVSELTTFRGETYFRFNDTDHGVELWKTDGTQAGTQLVKDIYPGPQGGSPRDLVVLGDELYFTANDGRHGYELWRTDGTSDGTRMVADIWPGPEHSNPSGLSVVNDELVFGASDGVAGSGKIWKLDGTEIVVLRELDEEASLLLVPTAGVMHAGDSLFVVSSSGVVGQLFGDSISVRDRSPMYALAEPVTNDGTFFVAALFRGRTGIYRVTDRLFSTLALFDSNDETPALPRLAKFDNNVYFVDDDGTGVGRYLESTRSELTALPENSLGIASTTTHLFSVNESNERFTISTMDKLGEGELLVGRSRGKPLRLFDDDVGITLVVRDKDRIEVWYSDGSRTGSRVVEELDAETEIREVTRSGDRLLVLQARPDGSETLLSLSLELNGDVTQDGRLDATDIDAMYAAIASNETDSRFDLNQDSTVDQADVELLVTRDLATNFGDLNLDGRVSFADFLTLSQNFGKQDANYSDGDVDGNGEVGFSDFLLLSESFGK